MRPLAVRRVSVARSAMYPDSDALVRVRIPRKVVRPDRGEIHRCRFWEGTRSYGLRIVSAICRRVALSCVKREAGGFSVDCALIVEASSFCTSKTFELDSGDGD